MVILILTLLTLRRATTALTLSHQGSDAAAPLVPLGRAETVVPERSPIPLNSKPFT